MPTGSVARKVFVSGYSAAHLSKYVIAKVRSQSASLRILEPLISTIRTAWVIEGKVGLQGGQPADVGV